MESTLVKSEVLVGTVENKVPPTQTDLSRADISERGSPENMDNLDDDSSYYVTWTVYIALAFPPEEDKICKVLEKGKRTVFSKANVDQGCYHIEYKLLPGDTETVKVDLVLFGPVAKLYKADESESLKTWREAGQTWVGWSQSFNVKVNRDLAVSLLSHKITVHIWNHKDKLFSERQKVLRLTLSDDTEMPGGVKTMVNKMRTLCGKKYSQRQPYHSTPKLDMGETDTTMSFHKAAEAGMASVEISAISFLAGELSLTNSALVCSCGVIESMIHISLDSPLLSDQLYAELNPLAITVLSATSMPSSPVPFHVLEEKCVPVYCQYKFHNLKTHVTNYKKHDAKIYFRDVNVILTGLLNLRDLHEFLSGPPVKIEIHDRDRKPDERTPARFGCGLDDGVLNNASMKRKTDVFNYHGVASLNLSELLLGRTHFKVRLPIKNCSPPPLLDVGMMAINRIPQGHYFDANSELRIEIKLACPLNFSNIGSELGSFEAPFGRIVYIFDCVNVAVMEKLRFEILKSNAEAFDLGSHVGKNTEKALSNYTTHFKHSPSQDLDFVTGFHVLDKKTQIMVAEGLKHKAVRRLWEAVPMKLSGSKEEQVIVLYNSSLAFFRRIYDILDLGLRPVLLPEPLEAIMRKPLLYVEGTVPRECFQALIRLKQLCQVRSLKDAVQYDLFPSVDMILSLSRQYETSTEQWKESLASISQKEQPPVPIKSHSTIDTTNTREHPYSNQYVTFREPKDFIQENIRKVHEDSERLQKPVITVLRLKTAADRPAHNYSIQTFNSSELTKEWLQRQMAELPGRRFTFSQEYHSATVEPGTYTTITRKKDQAELLVAVQGKVPVLEAEDTPVKHGYRSVARLRTWNSGLSRSKKHPKTPDQARVEELRKPWRENILHTNILKPPLSRGPWTWSQRSQDFHLYCKAAPFLSTPPPSIHLAGDSLQEEQTLAARAQHSRWMKKLLYRDSSTGPVSEFKCHMARTDTFQDLLKDKPKKYSLRKPGMLLKPVPHLSVIRNSGDTTDVQRSRALAPGPCMDCSLNSRNNAIPRQSSEFSKYHYMRFNRKPSFVYKRPAPPLTDQEKDIFTFSRHVTNHICGRNLSN